MATSVTKPEAVGLPGVRAALVRRALPLCVVAATAVALRLIYHPYLNYDARYALLWAHDVWHGATPDYGADFAPTPHPLSTAVSSLALPFGNGADDIVIWIVLLSFGVLVWLVYRLGAELFSPAVGAVTALVVLTRPALERDALLAYQDVPFAALVVWAVLLEARRPRRGLPVVVVLAVAGLLRPEAWLLAGAYVLYLWRDASTHERLRLAGVAALAPAIWAVSDLIVSGDLLHSLHGTADLAEAQDRRRSIPSVPYWTAKYFAFTLREPLVVGVPIGVAFAWRYRRRSAALLLAVAAVMTAIFAVGPVFGLPLIARYIRTPAVVLAVFFGVGVLGWRLLPDGRERRRWAAAAALALAVLIAFLPKNVDMLDGIHDRLARDSRLYDDLQNVGEAPPVRAAFATCGEASTSEHRPIPHLRWWLDAPPESVGTVEDRASPLAGLYVTPRPTPAVRQFYRENFPHVPAPAGYRLLYENRSWRVYAAPRCSA